MPAHRSGNIRALVSSGDEPLIAIFLDDDGEEVAYFSSHDAAREFLRASTDRALALAGVWRDLDWDEMAAALDRIRHESPPSSPLTL